MSCEEPKAERALPLTPTLGSLVRPLRQRGTLAIFLLLLLCLPPFATVRTGTDEALPDMPSDPALPEFECLERLLPAGVPLVFFSQPDGTFSPDASLHLFFAQTMLVPRLFVARPPESWRAGDIDWFVGLQPTPAAAVLAERHGLRLAGQCRGWVVLRRHP